MNRRLRVNQELLPRGLKLHKPEVCELKRGNFALDKQCKPLEIIIFTDTETVLKNPDWTGKQYWQFVTGYYQTHLYKYGRHWGMIDDGYYSTPREFHEIIAEEATFFRDKDIPYNVTVMTHNCNFDSTELGFGSTKFKRDFRYSVNMSRGIHYNPEDSGMLPYFLSLDFQECLTERLYLDKNLKYKIGYCSFSVLDSMNFFPNTKLGELGESVGIIKPDLPEITIEEYETDPEACRKELKERVTVDVKILAESYNQLREFTYKNFGVFPVITIGRCATACFANSKEFNESLKIESINDKQEIKLARPVAPTDLVAIDILKSTYKGARTECFFRGKELSDRKLYKYDINSMYPYLMKTLAVPTKFILALTNTKKFDRVINGINKNGQTTHTYLCRVNLRIRNNGENFYGFEGIPIKGKGLCFPVGKHNNIWLWKEQLEFAIERGWTSYKEIQELHIYESNKIFEKYIDRLYKMRQDYKEDGNKIYERLVKLLMNSLYGRFGMKASGNWKPCTDEVFLNSVGAKTKRNKHSTNIHDGEEDEIRHYHRCDDDVWYQYHPATQTYNKNSVPQIAHFITSMGRLMLTKTFYEVMKKGGRVYYCDTDSMITDIFYEHSKELGRWKKEGESEAHRCAFFAPKHYFFDGKPTIKGVRFDKEVEVPDNKMSFIQLRWSKHNQLLKQGIVDQGGYVQEYIKQLSGENKKRKKCKDGEWARPLVI